MSEVLRDLSSVFTRAFVVAGLIMVMPIAGEFGRRSKATEAAAGTPLQREE